ncbi:MAG: fatty acid desaturase [Granulosicoccus sp.]|jgi:fatty acid desaturase
MNAIVLTPITQALQEGALTRQELKALMQRSNKPALLHLLLWFCVLGVTTTVVWISIGHWYLVPAMLIHGIVLVHHFSLQHECCHYTAFKTRWLNDWVGNICGLVIMLPNRFFRYEHCDHHTFTQIIGKDTEMIELPKSLLGYLLYISSYPYWQSKFSELWRHCLGRLTANDKSFVPRQEWKTVIWEARFMAAFYAIVILVTALFQFWEVLWFWFLPVVLGEPVMRAIRMTEHVGRPTVTDMKTNTRSNRVALPWRFLCWNMNYHAEHHYASSVPFHALPALSEKLEGYIYTEKQGYFGAHVDIVSQLIGKSPRSDSA